MNGKAAALEGAWVKAEGLGEFFHDVAADLPRR
jgi:hypothetical protein